MPVAVDRRKEGNDGNGGVGGVVKMVADYVKDGTGWRCVEMKETLLDGGKSKSAGRAGESTVLSKGMGQ